MAPQGLEHVQPFVGPGAGVGQHQVRRHGARQHLAQRHPPGMLVAQGLAHHQQRGPGGVAGHLGLLVPGPHPLGPLAGGRAQLGQQAGQAVHPDPGGPGAAQHREHGPGGHAAGQAGLEFVAPDGLAVEVAGHEVVVTHHDALDQLLVDLVLGDGELVGDRAGGAGHRGAAGRVVEGGGVVEQVDDTPEGRLGPHRELHRGHTGPEGGAHLGQGAVEVGPLPVQLGHHHHPGQAQGGGGPPGVLGLRLHAVGGAHHHHRQVAHRQRGVQVAGEVGVAGGVDEVDLDAVHRHRGQGQRHRELAGHLLGLHVAHGGALLHRALPGDGAGRRQERLDQRGLSGAVVADQGHVADASG